jgi:L-lactate dehydrogenase complex protein LldG
VSSTSSAREAILKGVRDALARPWPAEHHAPGPAWPTRADDAPADPADAFRAKVESVGGFWHRASDLADAAARIDALALADGPIWVTLDGLPLRRGPVLRTPPPRDAFDGLAAAVTGVSAAVVETGSLALFFGPGAGRLPSLVVPVHVAVVRREQLVPTLDDFLARVRGHLGPRSAAVLVTGPSRSADIEQVITVGVHGPKELHVVFID